MSQSNLHNWNKDKVELILGPPGTGKTYTLMEKLDSALKIYDPRRICFVAFTKKAAIEAITRASEKFGLTSEDLLHFRTLHSFAFRMMGYSSKQIMGVADYVEIAKTLGLFISYRGIREDGSLQGQTKGDRLLFLANLSRLQQKTIDEIHSEWIDESLSVHEIRLMYDTIEAYKFEHGKKDFTDVIQDYITSGFVPDMDVLFVDEAQDLAPVQWTMVSKLAERAGEVYIAGDDDQAIFRWAGADVAQFISLPARTTTVLNQSYRVPSRIATCANRIVSTIGNRHSKSWKPRLEQGRAVFINQIHYLDLSQGTWLLLARNSYLLDAYTSMCMERGLVFESSQGSPITGELLAGIRMWERLRKGKYITMDQARNIYSMMSSKIGVAYGYKTSIENANDDEVVNIDILKEKYGLLVDSIWYEALDRIPLDQKNYLLTALRKGEELDQDPRIKISTIHGVKGGEADNVVLFTDMAKRTYQEYLANPDDEARVWYVAVTRAKQNLFIMNPCTPNHYPLDTILRNH